MKINHEWQKILLDKKYTWLITGVAGFIGSNLAESLLKLNQKIIGIDNFSTGYKSNLTQLLKNISSDQINNFEFYEIDIRSINDCKKIIKNIDFVLHHAALASVPASILEPELINFVNVDGFLNVLCAAKNAGVRRFIYASSSSVYGNVEKFPLIETYFGTLLSPYAVTKYVNELYASTFTSCYQIETIGLRYFNVFGPRQDFNGAYAAVIPLWTTALLNQSPVYIYGDGQTTRDFCYIEDVIQANILAALIDKKEAINTVYNIASGEEIILNQLYNNLCEILNLDYVSPIYADFRKGDIRRSYAAIEKAKKLLGYRPFYGIKKGLLETIKPHFYKMCDMQKYS